MDLSGCTEFLFESMKEFYLEKKTHINRKMNTNNNILDRLKLTTDDVDVGIDIEIEAVVDNAEEVNRMFVSEEEMMILSDQIAPLCVGYTGAELKMVIKKAFTNYHHDNEEKENEKEEMNEIGNESKHLRIESNENEFRHKLKFKYFEKASSDLKRSVTTTDIKEFEKWAKERK